MLRKVNKIIQLDRIHVFHVYTIIRFTIRFIDRIWFLIWLDLIYHNYYSTR